MTQDACDLSIVIVARNCRDVLHDCLRSVLADDGGVTTEIIVVDNASADGTYEMLRASFPDVRVERSEVNLGFTRGNNFAFTLARGRHVLLLNADTIVPRRGSLAELVKYLDSHPDVAGVGCRLEYPDGRHQVGDAGFEPSARTVVSHALALSTIVPARARGLFLSSRQAIGRDPIDVDWICGACFLVRRNIIQTLGGLDERFFIYAEDVEWGSRIRRHGHRIVYLPSVTVIHLGGATWKAEGRRVSTAWLDNLGRLYASRVPRWTWRATWPLLAVGFVARAALSAMSSVVTLQRWRLARAIALLAYARQVVVSTMARA